MDDSASFYHRRLAKEELTIRLELLYNGALSIVAPGISQSWSRDRSV
jgi:hypothetical protein